MGNDGQQEVVGIGFVYIKIIVMTFLVRECYGSPKISINFVKIRQNSLKFTPEECYDKVLNEEFLKKLFCKMKNVITRIKINTSQITQVDEVLHAPALTKNLLSMNQITSKGTNNTKFSCGSYIIKGRTPSNKKKFNSM